MVYIKKQIKFHHTKDWEITRFFDNYPSQNREKRFTKKWNLELVKNSKDKDYIKPSFHDSSADVAIAFSGGIDSLSLALRHLEEKETINLLSVGFNPEEQIAAELSVEILRNIYGSDKIKFTKILSPLFLQGTESTTGLTQQPIVAFLASFMPDGLCKVAKSFEIAYCMNDDAVSYLKELEELYNTAFKFKRQNFQYPKITFPIIKTKHLENIDYISFIEQKYNIIFPTFSSETCSTHVYERKDARLFFIRAEDNSKKENKQCSFAGYLIKVRL